MSSTLALLKSVSPHFRDPQSWLLIFHMHIEFQTNQSIVKVSLFFSPTYQPNLQLVLLPQQHPIMGAYHVATQSTYHHPTCGKYWSSRSRFYTLRMFCDHKSGSGACISRVSRIYVAGFGALFNSVSGVSSEDGGTCVVLRLGVFEKRLCGTTNRICRLAGPCG